jgi:hypothetical protein
MLLNINHWSFVDPRVLARALLLLLLCLRLALIKTCLHLVSHQPLDNHAQVKKMAYIITSPQRRTFWQKWKEEISWNTMRCMVISMALTSQQFEKSSLKGKSAF